MERELKTREWQIELRGKALRRRAYLRLRGTLSSNEWIFLAQCWPHHEQRRGEFIRVIRYQRRSGVPGIAPGRRSPSRLFRPLPQEGNQEPNRGARRADHRGRHG